MTSMVTRRALCLTAALLLAACGKKDDAAPAGASAAASGAAAGKVYVVGTDAAYAPFESQDEKGNLVGFSIDLMRAVATKGGFEIRFVNTPWEGIFNALAQGDRDIVISSVTITDKRRETMDFSDPYFDARQLIAVRKDSPVAKFDDLRKLQVGVQTGTTGDEVMKTLQGETSTSIKRFESTPLALKELESGGVDAVVADNGVISHYVAHNTAAFKTVNDPSFARETYGIAVRKGNAELLAKINQGLAAARTDGTYDRLYTQYFGAPTQAPAPPSAAASAPASAASK